MRRTVALLAAVLLFFGGSASAQTVTVSGYGTTEAEAENDALRNAVEKAVGTMVDSSTIVDKSVVIKDEIYTQSRGFITNYTVVDKRQSGADWLVVVDAVVDDSPDSKLMTDLTRLGIIDKRLRDPKIVVYIPEYLGDTKVPDSAVETAVVKKLVKAGFSNVIAAAPGTVQDESDNYYWSENSGEELNEEDLRKAARFTKADILIMGETNSEPLGDVGQWFGGKETGLHSSRARIDAKMYIAETGQIIAADGVNATAADVSDLAASKKALASLGKQMGEYFLEQLMNTGSGSRQGMEVTVNGDSGAVDRLQQALVGVQGVKNVQLRSYTDGKAEFTLQYSGSPQVLFRELQAVMDGELEMDGVTYNTLSVSVHS